LLRIEQDKLHRAFVVFNKRGLKLNTWESFQQQGGQALNTAIHLDKAHTHAMAQL